MEKMEYGENRPADKVHGGFRQRAFGDVLTKQDISYALPTILIKSGKRCSFSALPAFYIFSTHKSFLFRRFKIIYRFQHLYNLHRILQYV